MNELDVDLSEDLICCIGMVGKFPGAGMDLNAHWKNLIAGRDCISHFSEEELLASGTAEAMLKKAYFVGAKGIVNDVDLFDAEFFNMNANEALILDPQQRQFLQGAWRLLEEIAYNPDTYPGKLGVFASIDANTYLINNYLPNKSLFDSAGLIQNIMNDKEYLATRVAYHLNCRGPAMAIQSACSSSLLAVHQACESLLNFETDMAFAGGVSISVPIKNGYICEAGGILSSDGRCRTFDRDANGTVYGSGYGIVALKRLSDALIGGDSILAIIRGSAANNDGALKVGFTAPSVIGQTLVMKEAMQTAGILPNEIGYVETHGTGTKLGDSIELEAMSRAYEGAFQCYIGSVKPNLGHLSVAAGVAGLIKVILMMKNKQIPPLVNYDNDNEVLNKTLFQINTQRQPWQQKASTRIACINSFGMGGTNCSVVVEEFISTDKPLSSNDVGASLICLSAKTSSALIAMKKNLAAYLQHQPETVRLSDLAYTLHLGRRDFRYRTAFLCDDRQKAIRLLVGKQSDSQAQASVYHAVTERKNLRFAFLFNGESDHYLGMAQGLYLRFHYFRDLFDKHHQQVETRLGLNIKSIFFVQADNSNQLTEHLQKPSLTYVSLVLIEYTLAHWLMSLNIRPIAMMGYRVGEYAAAVLSGVMSFEEAIELAYIRGQLVESVETETGQLTVYGNESLLKNYLSEGICLAAINGKNNVVLSGSKIALMKLRQQILRHSIDCEQVVVSKKRLDSNLLDSVLDKFRQCVNKISFSPANTPYISSFTGDWVDSYELASPEYWINQFRRALQFSPVAKARFSIEIDHCIEIGVNDGLSRSIWQSDISSLRQEQFIETFPQTKSEKADNNREQKHIAEVNCLLTLLSTIWLNGHALAWQSLYSPKNMHRLLLPTYPFEEKSYWLQPTLPKTDGEANLQDPQQKANELSILNVQKNVKQRPQHLSSAYVAPESEIEKRVTEYFEHDLGFQGIGIHDNFFALGGNSLVAISILFKISKQFEIEIPATHIFENPTVYQIAQYIEAISWLKLPDKIHEESNAESSGASTSQIFEI